MTCRRPSVGCDNCLCALRSPMKGAKASKHAAEERKRGRTLSLRNEPTPWTASGALGTRDLLVAGKVKTRSGAAVVVHSVVVSLRGKDGNPKRRRCHSQFGCRQCPWGGREPDAGVVAAWGSALGGFALSWRHALPGWPVLAQLRPACTTSLRRGGWPVRYGNPVARRSTCLFRDGLVLGR